MFGDRKNLANEHVILVPGPEDEVAIVRRIFHEFANERKGLAEIAAGLNGDGIGFWHGSKWNAGSVTRTLRHSAYAGQQVWGRTTAFLSAPVKRLPPEQWVVRLAAFESVISQELFDRAQTGFSRFTRNQSDADLLAQLRTLLGTHGKLTSRILEQSSCPGVTTYNRRFGSLLNAYERLGYRSPNETSVAFRVQAMLIRADLIRTILQEFPGQLQEVRPSRKYRAVLRNMRTGRLIGVAVAKRCRTVRGEGQWLLKPPSAERKRPTLVALLDGSNGAIDRLIVFPHMRFSGKSIRFTEEDEWLKTGIPLTRLSDLLVVVQRLRDTNTAKSRAKRG